MNNITKSIGENLEYVKIIVDNKIELAKINGAEKSAKIMSSIMMSAILGILLFMSVSFIGVGFGLYLGGILNSYFASFSIVGGVILTIAIFIYLLRKKIILEPVFEYIVNEIIDLD